MCRKIRFLGVNHGQKEPGFRCSLLIPVTPDPVRLGEHVFRDLAAGAVKGDPVGPDDSLK